MAKEYYFIPKVYETQLALGCNQWALDPTSWLIIRGVFKPTDTLNNTATTVFSIDRDTQVKTYIPNGHTDFMGNVVGLMGFVLEGDLDELAPEYEAQLAELSGVYQTTDNQEFIDYIATL